MVRPRQIGESLESARLYEIQKQLERVICELCKLNTSITTITTTTTP